MAVSGRKKRTPVPQIKLRAFTRTLYAHYEKNGRHSLPWRKTRDPYRILVSEVMLQQTQASRVEPKYGEFVKKFPTVQKLAGAPQREVLAAWQGLGYNRRAINLKRAAEVIVKHHNGKVPNSTAALIGLPSVGPYTAGAVRAFAWNEPGVFLETNVRTVFIHHFFPKKKKVKDADLMPLVEAAVDTGDPRNWYYAVMDYGAALKRSVGNETRKSAAYVKHSPFKGSRRELRGNVLKLLFGKPLTARSIRARLGVRAELLEDVLLQLTNEGFTQKSKGKYQLR